MSKSDERLEQTNGSVEPNVSRRSFLKGSGLALSLPLISGEAAEANAEPLAATIIGPEKQAITLMVNGKPMKASVEPRMTLLDCLRNDLDTTGAKRVCDRGTCGACTLQLDGKPVYACSVLAIEAQGKKIRTIEALSASNDKLHPVQKAFWDNDAQQCGFCTPGFVMACTSLLEKHPNPTDEQIKLGVGGNLCRCGTYVGIKGAIAQAAAEMKGGKRNG